MDSKATNFQKNSFYVVTIICVLIWFYAMGYQWLSFRWWFVGHRSNMYHHIIGAIIYFFPAFTLLVSFFIRHKIFFITLAIINGILIPIVAFMTLIPYT